MNEKGLRTDVLTGKITDGSFSFDSQSTIRRICNLKIFIEDASFIPSEGSRFWLNSRFSLEIGLKNMISGEIEYMPEGIYVIDSPSLLYNSTNRMLTVSGLDLISLWNGDRNGNLTSAYFIPMGTNIATAVRDIVMGIGGAETYLIDATDNVTTLDLSFMPGDNTICDVLVKLRDLYSDWEMFFDQNGCFHFQQIKDRTSDSLIYDFVDAAIEYQLDLDWQNIKNKIMIFGNLSNDGTQITATLIDNDPLSKLSVDKIGEIPLIIKDNTICTQSQADIRAKYELWKHGNFNEKITIECIPIYYLEVNRPIHVKVPDLNIDMTYLIDTIDCGLKFDSTMSITAYNILGHNFYDS